MKKIAKPTKTPAPATKLTAPVPARKSTVAPKIKAPAAPSPSAVVAKPKGSRVTIAAVFDVGFGNSLYIRGDEPALSWTRGVQLGNVAGAKWEIVLTGIDRPFQFKFLVNNVAWSTGGNFSASPGDSLSLTPSF